MRVSSVGLAAAAAYLAVLGVACSNPKGAKGSVDQVADAICDAAFRCCDRGEVDYFLGPFVDQDNCADRMRHQAELDPSSVIAAPFDNAAVVVPNISVLQRAIDEDRARIDAAALAVCIDFLQGITCNELVAPEPPPDGCQPPEPPPDLPCDPEKLVHGLVGEGGDCSSPGYSLECKQGMTCRSVDSLGVNGVCVRPGAEGDYCFDDSECGDELYCSLLDGTCQVPRQKGETCKYADETDTFPSSNTLLIKCADQLSCDPITDTCVGACERGARCASDSDCDADSGLQCIVGRCDSPRASGLPCTSSADCQDGLRCAIDPATGTDLICQDELAIGDSCNPSRNEDCASGFCDPTTYQCAAQVAAPGLCPSRSQAQCEDGYCDTTYVYCTSDTDCASASGTCNLTNYQCEPFCIALQPDGATCNYYYECQSGACVSGYCRTTPLADDQPCDSPTQCESGFCNYESPRVCQTLPLPNSSTCAYAAECESGVCYQGSCQNGLSEGADCTSTTDPPCGKDLYCDRTADPNACVPLLAAGAACDDSAQCRGTCTTRFGRTMCDATPADKTAVCDGQ